jgi:ABC-type multidrug transport system permease subunit
MYTVGSYYLAKIAAETPILCLLPMIFAVITYFKIGLTITASQFFYFYLIILLLSQCAASFGYFMSSIFHKEEMAVSLSPIIMMPIMLFGGQFANSGNIQAWISWF